MSSATTAKTSGAVLPDERFIPAGTVIFRQGDPGNEMFVIGDGRVRLSIGTQDGHEAEIGIFGKGEFFGELALLSDAPRSATATTVDDSVLLVVTRDVFSMMVQDDLDIVAPMMAAQGLRLSRANEPIQQLTQQLGRIRVAAHCLRRLLGVEPPRSFEVETVASELSLPPQAVAASIAALAQRGVGMVEGGRWTISSRDEVLRLVDAICDGSTV